MVFAGAIGLRLVMKISRVSEGNESEAPPPPHVINEAVKRAPEVDSDEHVSCTRVPGGTSTRGGGGDSTGVLPSEAQKHVGTLKRREFQGGATSHDMNKHNFGKEVSFFGTKEGKK